MQIDASLIHRHIIINSGLLTKQNKAVAGSFLVQKLHTFSDKCVRLRIFYRFSSWMVYFSML